MATANKTPPLIAPGVLCPKCKGPMLDERATKRTEKSPDYTCANMLCVEVKQGKSYRTAIWAEKNGSGAEQSAGGGLATGSPGAPSVEPTTEKPKLTKLYLEATEFVLDKIVPLYIDAEVGINSADIAACVQTVFIAASKER